MDGWNNSYNGILQRHSEASETVKVQQFNNARKTKISVELLHFYNTRALSSSTSLRTSLWTLYQTSYTQDRSLLARSSLSRGAPDSDVEPAYLCHGKHKLLTHQHI